MTTVEERVARGVEWLDTWRPDWEAGISLQRLIITSCCACVLGQTFGCYLNAPIGGDAATEAGFTTDGLYVDAGEYLAEMKALEAEWRRVITARREAADV